MEYKRYDRLSVLAHNKTNWRIKIRLTRMWPGFDRVSGQFRGYNMILVDDDVSL